MSKINANGLSAFFKKVYLNGVIGSCKVTTYEDGMWLVEAIDEQTSVLLSCQVNVGTKDEWDLGIGDIGILMKWLTIVGADEIEIKKKDNKITFKNKKKGNLNYLLSEIDSITTVLEVEGDETPLDKILDHVKFQITLSKSDKESFISLMGVIKPTIINLNIDKGKVSLTGGSENEHNFKLEIGEVKTKESFNISIDGNALLNVLSVINNEPEIRFEKDIPVVIKENDDCMWAINIITNEED